VGDIGKGASGSGSGVDCGEAVKQLYFYLDGELTEQRRSDIASHLDECGPCSGAAVFEKELRAVIADRCRERVPDSLITRVADAIHLEAAQRHGGEG
jgi:mycothiol system anti-sigma-R factor